MYSYPPSRSRKRFAVCRDHRRPDVARVEDLKRRLDGFKFREGWIGTSKDESFPVGDSAVDRDHVMEILAVREAPQITTRILTLT